MSEAAHRDLILLFSSCIVTPDRWDEVDSSVKRIASGRSRYDGLAATTGVPWWFVGLLHSLESACDFGTHLANGDPLSGRTTHEPKGLPTQGTPPFSFESAAIAALEYEGFVGFTSWTLGETLDRLETYNGLGYRLRGMNSPYLWSFSQHYSKGLFVKDGVFDSDAVSKQAGAAVILRRMCEMGEVDFNISPDDFGWYYSPKTKSEEAKSLQTWLNGFPGIYLRVDGYAGKKTADAYRRVTGQDLAYLQTPQ